MIFHLMTIVLILLKAFAVIDISWWLVFAPSIFAVLVFVGLVFAGIKALKALSE